MAIETTSSVTVRMVFLHQSTGADLIREGNVRELLRQRLPTLEFWDYGFNPPSLIGVLRGLVRRPSLMPSHYYGLGDAAGRRRAVSYGVGDTNPDGLAALFAQPMTTPPTNALSHLLQYDAIAFKSCFTIFPIRSEQQLQHYQLQYRSVLDTVDRHPMKLFLPLTPPPLRVNLSTPEEAARARAFADWMMSTDFTGGRANLVPFDLFDALAVPRSQPNANTLRGEYSRAGAFDSHPNAEASQQVATQWVSFLAATIQHFTAFSQQTLSSKGRTS